ncbi:kinase domain protein (macronuclear) [Tetrahymena thermophila SB210]|uniref:Kinase domain protein n=1 Tax=Tetrahymena thermophila (strain SB210) TaxID=312017 RepID=I7LTS2_TETTS|nr:kinase domain protein [Tetrahymena thermophila SB210]EAR86047.1 kinase domain protein [Tetrahymena thermophila SB210]|eukprot:XP_976642.1 kinase domain protein [Tetrahymena thermophila SB210]
MPPKSPIPIPSGESLVYVAPEIINYTGRLSIDDYLKSDIYSLGIILYQLNFLSIPTQQQIDNILTTKLYIDSDISYGMMDLLQRMLCKDPLKRITAKQALVHQVFLKNKQTQGGNARYNFNKRPSKILQTIVERTFDHSELTNSNLRSEDEQKQHNSYFYNMQQLSSEQNILQSLNSNHNISLAKDNSIQPNYSIINQPSGQYNSFCSSPSDQKKNIFNNSNSIGANFSNSLGNASSSDSQNFIQYPSHMTPQTNPNAENLQFMGKDAIINKINGQEEEEEESITKESSFEDNNQNQNEIQSTKQQDGNKNSQKNSQIRSNKMKESKESRLDISDEMPEQDDDYTYCAASHLMKENIRRTYPQYAFISQLPFQLDKISQIK